jgi:hypothetical protein
VAAGATTTTALLLRAPFFIQIGRFHPDRARADQDEKISFMPRQAPDRHKIKKNY